MGMTDRQFDAHTQGLIRYLEAIKEELENENVKNKKLDILMEDLKAQIKRP